MRFGCHYSIFLAQRILLKQRLSLVLVRPAISLIPVFFILHNIKRAGRIYIISSFLAPEYFMVVFFSLLSWKMFIMFIMYFMMFMI